MAALLGAVACEQALSIDGTVTVVRHDACGLPMNPGSCQTCVASSCCSQASACAGDPSCAEFESCLIDCGGDYACRNQCSIDHPASSIRAGPPMNQCLAAACGEACGTACGLPVVPTYPDAAAGCATCVAGKLCTGARACSTSLQCETVSQCLANCSTVDCHDSCLALDDSGTFASLEIGFVGACLKACDLGDFWSCVGQVSWPLLPPGDQDLTFTLTDSTSGEPVVGATVLGCDVADETCATPLAHATSDAAGRAFLVLPHQSVQNFGFAGYVDIAPAADAAAEEHQLFFPSCPQTVPHAQVPFSMLSRVGFADLASSAGVTPDPARGQIAVQAVDCFLAPASNVVFSAEGIDAETRLVYLAGGILQTSASATDISGVAFLLDVPTGNTITLKATPKTTGKVSSTVTVFTRPGVLTSVLALPTP